MKFDPSYHRAIWPKYPSDSRNQGGEMTDRELLELAAKAAGMPQPPKGQEIPQDLPVVFTENGKPWNPLTDDGDALRLAVKLGLCVQVLHKYGETQVFRQTGYELEKHNSDPLAATRRAITRAAAEIGKGMK